LACDNAMQDVYMCVVQYAVSEALAKESVDADAFVDAARTHGLGMWKIDCRYSSASSS